MKERMDDEENILVAELITYANSLSKENLEHLVWIGEGMCHATRTETKTED